MPAVANIFLSQISSPSAGSPPLCFLSVDKVVYSLNIIRVLTGTLRSVGFTLAILCFAYRFHIHAANSDVFEFLLLDICLRAHTHTHTYINNFKM